MPPLMPGVHATATYKLQTKMYADSRVSARGVTFKVAPTMAAQQNVFASPLVPGG